MIEKYNLNLQKIITVVYRGTDKYLETQLTDPQLYIAQAKQLLDQNPAYRLLIVSDQKQVRDLFVSQFGNQCIFFEEMRVTEGKTSIHVLPQEDPLTYAKLVLAVFHLLSQSKFVILGSGNMSAWMCLFRGNADCVIQFDRNGNLITENNINYLSIVENSMTMKQPLRRLAYRLLYNREV